MCKSPPQKIRPQASLEQESISQSAESCRSESADLEWQGSSEHDSDDDWGDEELDDFQHKGLSSDVGTASVVRAHDAKNDAHKNLGHGQKADTLQCKSHAALPSQSAAGIASAHARDGFDIHSSALTNEKDMRSEQSTATGCNLISTGCIPLSNVHTFDSEETMERTVSHALVYELGQHNDKDKSSEKEIAEENFTPLDREKSPGDSVPVADVYSCTLSENLW